MFVESWNCYHEMWDLEKILSSETAKSKAKTLKTVGITSLSKQPCAINNEGNTSLNDSKCSSDPRKCQLRFISLRKLKLRDTNWWYPSHGFLLQVCLLNQIKFWSHSSSTVSKHFCPFPVQSIPSMPSIYATYQITETKQPVQQSSCTDNSRDSRLHP